MAFTSGWLCNHELRNPCARAPPPGAKFWRRHCRRDASVTCLWREIAVIRFNVMDFSRSLPLGPVTRPVSLRFGDTTTHVENRRLMHCTRVPFSAPVRCSLTTLRMTLSGWCCWLSESPIRWKVTRNCRKGHPRSLTLLPMQSARATSY